MNEKNMAGTGAETAEAGPVTALTVAWERRRAQSNSQIGLFKKNRQDIFMYEWTPERTTKNQRAKLQASRQASQLGQTTINEANERLRRLFPTASSARLQESSVETLT